MCGCSRGERKGVTLHVVIIIICGCLDVSFPQTISYLLAREDSTPDSRALVNAMLVLEAEKPLGKIYYNIID
jgi:hypothetical protein